MKTKLNFVFVLFCCMGILYYAMIGICTAQTQEEIEDIQSATAEYERIHPKPEIPHVDISLFWVEKSTDGKNLDIIPNKFEDSIVVYMDSSNQSYHMGSCRYYADKSNEDYSNPCWLSEVVLDGIRCELCVSDEIYYKYREIALRVDIQKGKQVVKLVVCVFVVLGITNITFFIIKKKRYKNVLTN